MDFRLRRLKNAWQELRASIQNAPTSESILIIPSDPYQLVASVGDQAMIGSIIGYWRQKFPSHQLYIATAAPDADEAAKTLGAQPIRMMGKDIRLTEVRDVVEKYRFAVAVLMGADGVDGSYDPAFSGRQLMTLDLAARKGADAYITGFSVSLAFHPAVQEIFRQMDPSIRINLRDPLSYKRFSSEASVPAHQVADVAFLLKGEESTRMVPLLGWIEQQKQQDRKVLALNFHPLLLELNQRNRFDELVGAFVKTLCQLAETEKVSFFLLSHDARGDSADVHGLAPIAAALQPQLGDRMLNPDIQLKAAEIKALVKHFDAVISGRMHLMIASLGAGTPVFGIDYKDKMEGLLSLLGLDTANLTSAAAILESPKSVATQIKGFLNQAPIEREKISSRIGDIQNLAAANFENETAS